MAEPLRITRSLDEITTRYTVFEEDQVLTHVQLNDLAGYLDDQDRLTRVGLLGIGIVCGLRVSLSQDQHVVVAKGVGVTTDGDLLRLPAEARFDRFKPYDKTAPVYPPFYTGQDVSKEMLPVFELVREKEEDSRATALGELAAQAGVKLGEMAALLFMESYVKDDDLCSGTDCDNLGQGSLHTTKVLLIGKANLAALRESLRTLDQAARSLPEVTADRPPVAAGFNVAVYRPVCARLHDALAGALRALYPACSSLLADLFAADPAGEWIARLEALRGNFAGSDAGLQYYYDFLKDLAETYNAFRDLLFGDATLCCPDLGSFPKHLLLGGLDGGAELRTGFYPSPLTSRTAAGPAHARFLAGKLDTLIRTFKLPVGGGTIRVTPSRCEDRSLEERAIPFYYEVNDALPVYRSWSHALTQRGMEKNNYSYSADSYNPGAVARQLGTQIGRFDFFRIEGHLGHGVAEAVKLLETEIRSKNLPIRLRAVALSDDRTKVVVKPPARYTDLHRIHYVLRQDLVSQLEDSKRFSGSFKGQVDDAVARNVIVDQSEDTDGASVRAIAEQKNTAVITGSTAASTKLNRSYAEYVQDPSWKRDVAGTQTAAGEFKADLGKVVKTEFATPFDSLIGSNHMLWLGWMDDMIKTRNDQDDDKLLFAQFLDRHPGLEHFAGVTRGGTFVLAYDANNTVVADFMLPYLCCDPDEAATPEPPLPRPDVKPAFVLEQGVKVLPSREKVVNDKLTAFRADVVKIQSSYVDAFKDSITLVGKVLTPAARTAVGPKVADPLLDLQIREMDFQREKVDFLRAEMLKTNIDADRQKVLDTQLQSAETALAAAAGTTTQILATSGLDVKEGTDGFTALEAVSESVGRLSNKAALEQVKGGLTTASANAKATTELKGALGKVLKTRGLS